MLPKYVEELLEQEEEIMSRVLVIGCGGVASVAIHKICQVSEVYLQTCALRAGQ